MFRAIFSLIIRSILIVFTVELLLSHDSSRQRRTWTKAEAV